VSVLRLEEVSAGYGGGTVLHRLTMAVRAGSVHAVVGHNGAGKTTLLHTVAGLQPASGGRILLSGRELTRQPAHQRARAGIGLVPQGRRVFASLTVAEHLRTAWRRTGPAGAWTPDRVLALLPQLAARRRHRGGQLSGGEQQMLAIARALLTQPRLLLLDEPTEGLAPNLAAEIERLIGQLAADGLTILLAAPQPALPLAVADEIAVLATGRLTQHLDRATLRARPDMLTAALTPT
jgi:branched-chain amino acid transport system ATP-binding protein